MSRHIHGSNHSPGRTLEVCHEALSGILSACDVATVDGAGVNSFVRSDFQLERRLEALRNDETEPTGPS